MPDWKNAPEWAKWWAIDEDGSGWWYKLKPVIKAVGDFPWRVWGVSDPLNNDNVTNDGMRGIDIQSMNNDATDWQQSLTQRPDGP